MSALKGLMVIAGIAMTVMGGLWMLQGLGFVQWPAGSGMFGDLVWTRNGAILAAAGVLLIVLGRKGAD